MGAGGSLQTLVFWDVDGAAALWVRDPETMRASLAVLDRVVVHRLASVTGVTAVPCGTGRLTVWPDAAMALRFCLAVQDDLTAAPWPSALLEQPEAASVGTPSRPVLVGLRLRMGVHVGAAMSGLLAPWSGPGDRRRFGVAVRRAARIAGAARGGQVLLTEVCRAEIDSDADRGITFLDLGERRLRGVPGLVRLFDARSERTLGRELGALRTRDVERTNLVPERNAFLGRDGDIAAIAELFDLGVRAISVVGPDGVGRSRLCRALVERLLGRFATNAGGGAWVVDCAPVTDLDAFLHVISSSLDLALGGGRTLQDAAQIIARTLAARGEVLLVLDGLEDWFPDARAVVSAWVGRVPHLRVLITAADAVGLPGEVPYRLRPLALPGKGHPMRSPAVRLLLRRVRERGGVNVSSVTHVATAEVLGLAGGLPLVAELLAGQAAVRPLADVAADLTGRLHPRSTAEECLAAVLDVGLTHLTSWERGVLSRLAVFQAAFDADAAGAVAQIDDWVGAPAIDDALSRLRDRGLLEEGSDAEDPMAVWFRVHPAVRAHLLVVFSSVEMSAASERLAEHAIARAQACVGDVAGVHGAEALAVLEELSFGLIGAYEFAMEAVNLGLDKRGLAADAVLALDPLFSRRGPIRAHEARLDQVIALLLDAAEHSALLVQLLRARARVRYLRGALADSEADLLAARDIACKAGDAVGEGIACGALGQLYASTRRTSDAVGVLEHGLLLLQDSASHRERATVRAALGEVLSGLGKLDAAEEHLADAVAGFHAGGDRAREGLALCSLGDVRRRLGHVALAERDLREALSRHRAVGDRRRQAVVLLHLGALLHHQGDLDAALEVLEAARDIAREHADHATTAAVVCRIGAVLLERRELPRARDLFHEGLAIARDAGAGRVEAMASALLGALHHLDGDAARALAHYAEATSLLAERGESRTEVAIHVLKSGAHAALGQAADADAALARANDLVRSLDDRAIAWLVHVAEPWIAHLLGRAAPASRDLAWTRAQLKGLATPHPVARLLRLLVG